MAENNKKQDSKDQGSSRSPSSCQARSTAATNTGSSRPSSNYTYSADPWGVRTRPRTPPLPLLASSRLLYERPPPAMAVIPPPPEPLGIPSRYFEPGPTGPAWSSQNAMGSTTPSTPSAASTPAPRRESRGVLEREASGLSNRRESGNVLRQALDRLGKGEKEDRGKGRDSGKTRHVKCDETPSSCKNCTSTGRTCDYDLQRLPRSGRATAVRNGAANRQPLSPAVASGFRWAITTDEQRCFAHFRDHTVPTLSQFFDSPLWQDLVLQMSHSEAAVYHAVVALSAIHEDSETYGPPLPGQDLQNDWHRFALEQCGRSFTLLSRRCSSQDPRFREVMLLCCLLFVLTQLLRGQYDDAFQHLESGLRILNEARNQGGYERSVSPCVIAAFIKLEVQSLQYGVQGASSVDYELEQPMDRMADYGGYPSLHEARQALDLLLGAAFRFLGQCGVLSEVEILLDYCSMHHKQLQLLSRLSVFGDRLERFCLRSRLNQKERRGADLLRLVYQSLSLPIKTALIRDDATLDYYTPEFEAHLSAVEGFLDRFPERPTVTLDIGILPSLYYAAMGCRDYRIRHRAIAALRSWPHREGSFDSNWLAFIALERIKAEFRAQPELDGMTRHSGPYLNRTRGRWPGMGSNYSLNDALRSTRCMKRWPCVQAIQQISASKIN
ncbi:hypothetical protein BDV11DRAFT_166632 [Aspergillus similis]